MNNLVLLVDSKTIQQSVVNIARAIEKMASPHHKMLLVCILNGGMYFCTDLSREIQTPHEITTIKAKSREGTHQKELEIETTLHLNLFENRDVYLIDELWDTGKTLLSLKEILIPDKLKSFFDKSFSPYRVTTVTMFVKKGVSQYKPDLFGMEVENKWLVGYGLDDNGLFRNTKDLYYKETHQWSWYDGSQWIDVPTNPSVWYDGKSENEALEEEYQSHLRSVRIGFLVFHCFGDKTSAHINYDRMETTCGSGRCLDHHGSDVKDDHMTYKLKRI